MDSLIIGLSLAGFWFLCFLVAWVHTRLARRRNTKIVDTLQRINKQRFIKWAKDIGLLEATDEEITMPSYFFSTVYYYNGNSKIRVRALIGDSQFSMFYKIDPEDLASILSSLAHLLPSVQLDIAGQLCDYYKPRKLEMILEEMSFRHHEAAKAVSQLVEDELQRREDRNQAEKDERMLIK